MSVERFAGSSMPPEVDALLRVMADARATEADQAEAMIRLGEWFSAERLSGSPINR
jgi:hypothetical protein